MSEISRRQFVVGVPGMTLVGALLNGVPVLSAEAGEVESQQRAEVWPDFPRQNPKLVREIVGAAHTNEAKVRALLEQAPALVNAWWDWGFGDWESPLGAAAHTGRRNIAELLIERGARVDIFAAAMLGWTDVVKGFVAASPGIQRTHGPHGIPLLAHAEAGDERAKDTAAYLASLGDAGNANPTAALPDEQKQTYVGEYRFGPGAGERFNVTVEKGKLKLTKPEESSVQIHYLGEDQFYPAGVPSVRIQFAMQDGKPTALTILQHEPVVTATRMEA
jgi:hypothetical protein